MIMRAELKVKNIDVEIVRLIRKDFLWNLRGEAYASPLLWIQARIGLIPASWQ